MSLPTSRGAFSAASDLRLWASQALGDGHGAWVAFTPVEAHHAPFVFSTSHQHHLFSFSSSSHPPLLLLFFNLPHEPLTTTLPICLHFYALPLCANETPSSTPPPSDTPSSTLQVKADTLPRPPSAVAR